MGLVQPSSQALMSRRAPANEQGRLQGATSGIMSITGNEGQPPSRVGMSIGDIGAGLYTAVAVNAALVHRLKTGESTKVDIAMFDCQLALLENAIMRYTVEKEIPGPLGARMATVLSAPARGRISVISA